jgi:hypothetical protein
MIERVQGVKGSRGQVKVKFINPLTLESLNPLSTKLEKFQKEER